MKEAEKANELRHALEDENQRLTDEVNEKIGNLEDVQERVADAEDELAELEPKHAQAKKDIEDTDKKKHEVFKTTYALKNAMGTLDVYGSEQIIANAKRWADDLTERESEIARQKAANDRRAHLIANKANRSMRC